MFGGGGGGGAPMGQNPANAGMQYLNQIPGIGRQYYQPFVNEGQQASGVANPVYNQMTQDPNEFLNSIMRNYNPSEGYRFKENRLRQGMANDAAAGGFRGTQYDQEQQANSVSGILGQDMEQFLQNILGIQQGGLQGQENRIGRGFQASGNLADYLGNALGAQAGMAFQGQAQQNQNAVDAYNSQRQAKNNRRNTLFRTLATLGGGAAGNMANGVGFTGFGG